MMLRVSKLAFAVVCMASLLPLSLAHGQAAGEPTSQGEQEAGSTWVDISTWDTAHLYLGWSGDELLDEEAYGRNGELLGEVEDLIIGPDGVIQEVVVEGGGFLDIGDTHVAIDWPSVTRRGTESVKVPVDEDNLGEFGLFENVDDVPAEPRNFRVREMFGDYVTANGVAYGIVEDVIFSQEGRIEAVIVDPVYGYDYTLRPIALPYTADGYDPFTPYYEVPYGVAELEALRPFDYSELGS